MWGNMNSYLTNPQVLCGHADICEELLGQQGTDVDGQLSAVPQDYNTAWCLQQSDLFNFCCF